LFSFLLLSLSLFSNDKQMDVETAYNAYKLYGKVTNIQQTLSETKQNVEEKIDAAEEAIVKKANDLFGLRRGDLLGRLNVSVFSASGLASSDGFFQGKADPYVIFTLDGKELGRTNVASNSSEPKWNEIFSYQVDGTYEDFAFHVLDKDMDEDDHLGVAVISAKNLYKKRVVEGTFPLKRAKVEEIAALSGDAEPEKVKKGEKPPESEGTITVKVEYHPPRFEGLLDISIVSADGLYNADGGFMQGVSDPFVRVLIDNDRVAKTKTVKNDLSPVWNETLKVAVTGEHTTLFLVVHDDDHLSCDDCLGHIKISAAELMEKNQVAGTTKLLPKPGSEDEGKNFGTLTYSITHTPPVLQGLVKATIHRAEGLADTDHGLFAGRSDPFVVVKADDKEVARTSILKNAKVVEWNEVLNFPVTGETKALNFVVMDKDDDTADDHLGTVSFGAEQIIIDRNIAGKFSLTGNANETYVTGTLSLDITYTPDEE